MMKTILKVLTSIILLNTFSFADIIHVPADIDSIKGGIDLASNGDTVLVQPGTYFENIDFNGKNIVVGSLTLTTGDTAYISRTVIDGSRNGSVVTFENGEDSSAYLCGFTITGGRGFWGAPQWVIRGGGIFVNSSSPKLSHLLIINNILPVIMEVGGQGGGIYCGNSNTILNDVEIRDNTSMTGGGIFCENSNPTLINVTVNNNGANTMHFSGNAGGGIYFDNSSPILVNVKVSGNDSDGYGGGIYCNNSSPSFSNVTITRNSARAGGGIGFGGSNNNPSFDTVNRCNIYFNDAEYAFDLFSWDFVNTVIVLDTFTVMNPTDYFADPVENFTFDILNAKLEQVNNDLYVNPNGDNSNSGLSPAEPLKTITYALLKILADSLNPHTIYLADGIYSPSITGEKYPLHMRDYISLFGESTTGVILDADSLSSIMYFWDDQGITIENLTITGGLAKTGGAIYCSLSDPNFSNLLITGNTATSRGGGIAMFTGGAFPANRTNPIFSNVIISNNTAHDGGGVSCFHSDASFSNVTITRNAADREGGGIYFASYYPSSNPTLSNVILSNNTANDGGGVYCIYSAPKFFNVTFSGNNAINHGSAIYLAEQSSSSFVNAIMWVNTPENIFLRDISSKFYLIHSDIQGGWSGEGNIDTDPMFVDTSNGDYRLQAGSPCIDAGIQDTMIVYNDGQDTLIIPPMDYIGSAPDMGAYEYGDPLAVEQETIKLPNRYTLSQNYPNPFNPSTTIKFQLPNSEFTNLKVYSILGNEVMTIVSNKLNQGNHTYTFDGKNLASGVYYYQLVAGDYREVKKMILLR